jgi:3-hydroxy-3-methylglutaryl CoA synthase
LNRGGEAPNHGRGVVAVGAYARLLRRDRAAAAKDSQFSRFASREQGHRAVPSWDEDAVTKAIESARAIAPAPSAVVFASTSKPLIEKSHAGLLIDALAFAPSTRGHDISRSRRCAVSSLPAGPRQLGKVVFGLKDNLGGAPINGVAAASIFGRMN